MATRAEIKTKIWDEMVQNSSSSTYNSNKLNAMIDEVSEQIVDKQVYNEFTNAYVQISDLPFINGITAFDFISNPVTTAEVNVGDTEINCVTDDLPATGTIKLEWDIITYTSKSATQLLDVTGILLKHTAGTTVRLLYDAPADFGKPLKFYKVVNGEEQEVRGKWEGDSLVTYYDTIYSWDNTYIQVSNNVQWGYYIKYAKSYTYMTDDTDVSIFPDDIALNSLVFISAGRMIKDQQLRVQLLTKGYWNLTVASNKYNNQSGKTKKPRWKRFWFNSIR